MSRIVTILLFAAVLILALSLPTPLKFVSAQDSDNRVGLSVMPAILNIALEGVSSFSIEITNESDMLLPVAVGVRQLQEMDQIIDESLRTRYDATSWITPEVSDRILGPRESTSIRFTVIPPNQPAAGSYYALAVFRVINTLGALNQASSAIINPEVTSVVLLTVPGEADEKADFSLQHPPRILRMGRETPITYTLRNIGTSHILPYTTITIASNNESGYTAKIPPRVVLPNTEAVFQTPWTPPSWGWYTITLASSYGSSVQTVNLSLRIWVWPPFWITILLLTISIVVIRYGLQRVFMKIRKSRPRRLGYDVTHITATRRSPPKINIDTLSEEVPNERTPRLE